TFALVVFGEALDTVSVTMQTWPAALSDGQWAGAAHALTRFAGGGQIRLRLDGERPFIEDIAQRLYTRSGSFTPAGRKFIEEWAHQQVRPVTTTETIRYAVTRALTAPS